MTILINCTGKFCFRHGNFQNTEAATEGILRNFTKFTGKRLCQVFFLLKLQANFMKKETSTQILFCELCEIFKNNIFASDCISKYESLCMIVAGYSCLIKSYSENIWKILRSISALDSKFR